MSDRTRWRVVAIVSALIVIGGLTGLVVTTSVVSIDGDTVPLTTELQQGTDPLSADSDGDGLPDGSDPDPLDPDTDGDGLKDGLEVTRHGTDPTRSDTDEDGLDDYAEIHRYGTDPTERDTDQDFLADRTELDIGTDPTDADTDKDGYYDGVEVKADRLTEADPLRKDVFVELDWMERIRPDRSTFEPVIQVFSEAPIENPNGERGIALHITDSNQVDARLLLSNDSVAALSEEHRDFDACGYQYGVAVHSFYQFRGFYNGSTSAFIFEAKGSESEIRHTFMHELGHALGLGSREFDGIDSRTIAATNYSSVMNYDAADSLLQYNSGAPFDDWEFIESNLAAHNGDVCDVETSIDSG